MKRSFDQLHRNEVLINDENNGIPFWSDQLCTTMREFTPTQGESFSTTHPLHTQPPDFPYIDTTVNQAGLLV